MLKPDGRALGETTGHSSRKPLSTHTWAAAGVDTRHPHARPKCRCRSAHGASHEQHRPRKTPRFSERDMAAAHFRSSHHDPQYGYGYAPPPYLHPYLNYPPAHSSSYGHTPVAVGPYAFPGYGAVYQPPPPRGLHSQLGSSHISSSRSDGDMQSNSDGDRKCGSSPTACIYCT